MCIRDRSLARGHLQKQDRLARAAKVSANPGLGGEKTRRIEGCLRSGFLYRVFKSCRSLCRLPTAYGTLPVGFGIITAVGRFLDGCEAITALGFLFFFMSYQVFHTFFSFTSAVSF